MNQSITSWFAPKTNKSTALPPTKKRKKSTCVISTNSETENKNNKTKRKPTKRKRNDNDEDNDEQNDDTKTQSNKRRKLNTLLSFLTTPPNNNEENNNEFTVSRYGRKRKKINYYDQESLSLTPNDDEYKIESDENEPNKKKKKLKKKSLNSNQQKERTETFFMNKSQKRQYKRDKVMTEFAQQIAKRHCEDQRLFGGKKINPFFEITKKRHNLKQNNIQKETTSQPIDLIYFPKISSIKPVSNHIYTQNTTQFTIKCEDLIEDAFDVEMINIEKQIADLLYCNTQTTIYINDNTYEEVNNTIQVRPPTTPRYTHYWKTHEALNEYCASSAFCSMINQISREFPSMDHSTIKEELLMCLKRTTGDGWSLWSDKYKPLKASEVVGNWCVANELKNWLKSWRKDDDVDDNDYYDDDDDEWLLNESKSLSNIVLLSGPTACGKTSSVYAVAKELSYAVIEVNCTTIKTAKDLNDQIGEATQSQQVKSSVSSIVLLEEIDNMMWSAPSIINAITKFFNTSRCPIVLTAQHIPSSLKSLALTHFKFNHGSLDRLALRTHIIGLSEGICLTRNEIEKIVLFFDHDLRSVLINLQFWLSSPRTFDHFNVANNNEIPLPSTPNNEYNEAEIKEKIKFMHQSSVYQRMIGCADMSFNSGTGKDRIFWSHFVDEFKIDVKENDLNDNLYCFIQHLLDSNYTNHIPFNSFPFWFMDDIDSVSIHRDNDNDNDKIRYNVNPFTYSWTESHPVSQANNVIQSILNNMFECHDTPNTDIEMKEGITKTRDTVKSNDEWLQNWCIMTDTLSDNDILSSPHGSCLNRSYADRLHPHTMAIFDEALDVCVFNEEDIKCEIYDTIQHQYLKEYISPYLVALSIRLCRMKRNSTFEPKLSDDLISKQIAHNWICDNIADSFRKHPIEGNFDFPTTKAWFEYYEEFISTVCINEYHRQKKGGDQYRNGRALRRSRRMKNTFFEHVLDGWVTQDQSNQIVKQWILKFNGMGWKENTLPTL